MSNERQNGNVIGNGTRTEQELRASELSYRRLFEAAKDGILILDADTGRITDVNPFLYKLLGFSRSEMVGRTVGELSPFNDIWSNEVMLERLQRDGYIRYEDQPLETKDGRKIAVEFVSNVYQAGDKKVIQCNIRDITQRKLAEKTSIRLAAIVESSEDAIIGKDLDGIIQSWNAGAEKMLGYSAGEMIGNSIMRLIPAERMEEESHVLLNIKHGESMRNFETVWLAKDARRIDVSVAISPIKDSAGKIVGASKVVRDITERKRAEGALRASQQFIEGIINAIPVRVFWKDKNLVYLGCNTIFARDAGFADPKDIIGKDDNQMVWREQAEAYRSDDRKVIESGRPKLLIEESQTTPDGKTIALLSSKLPLRDASGEIIGMIGTYLDITPRKEAESAVLESRRFLRSTLDALSAHIAILDERGKIIEVNAAWRRFATGNAFMGSDCGMGDNYLQVCDSAVGRFAKEAPEAASGIRSLIAGQRDLFTLVYPCHSPQEKRWFILRATRFEGDGPVRVVVAHENISERKLAEEELQLFRELMDHSSDGVEVVDPETGRFIDVNETTCQRLGYTREELLTMHVGDLSNMGVDFSNWGKHVEKVRQAGFLNLEGRQKRKDGSTFPIEASIRYVKLERDYLLASVRDITERKRAENALREQERLLTESQRLGHVGSWFNDISGPVKWSEEMYHIYGVSPETFTPTVESLLGLIHPDDRPVMQRWLAACAAGAKPAELEFRINRPDGTIRYIRGAGDAVMDAGNKMIHMAGTAQDITEHKLAEASHARLAMAVEQAAETIIITDTSGTILYVNPAFEKTSGYTRAETLGQNSRLLKSGKHDDEFYRRMWQVLGHGETWSGHFINKRKDGVLYEEDATISPVRDAAGTVVNYVAVKRDVTREVQLEAQFRRSQKMEAIGKLAGGVAHDFNNILAIIQMQADLLKTEAGNTPAQLETAVEIGKAVQRASALTRQLLLFSRKQMLQLCDLDLNESINEMTKMLRRTLGENIQLQFKFAMQDVFVHADAGMMDQVLLNLALNARDAMPKGGQLVIETSAVELDKAAAAQIPNARPGSFVCLSVRDTGCGIPPENFQRIFEPFFTTKEVGKGTGLGLATVFGIVQQHQGWINVSSEVGKGTTFRIYLPRLVAMSGQKPEQSVTAAVRGGDETILLVEDDEALRASVRKILSQLGYCVLEAVNGIEALKIWEQHGKDIHLLLTDMMMPGGMTGKDLGERLLKKNPKLKVIYASGYSAEVASGEFPLKAGVNFLTKPFQAQQLAQTVRQMLDENSETHSNASHDSAPAGRSCD